MIHIIKKRENARAEARDELQVKELQVDGATLPASLELRQAPTGASGRIDRCSSRAGSDKASDTSVLTDITETISCRSYPGVYKHRIYEMPNNQGRCQDGDEDLDAEEYDPHLPTPYTFSGTLG